VSGAPQLAQAAPVRGAPQLEQNFPLDEAWQTGQTDTAMRGLKVRLAFCLERSA